MNRCAAPEASLQVSAPRRGLELAVAVAVVAAMLLAAAQGAASIPVADVLRVVAHHLGLPVDAPNASHDAIVWAIRMPRVVLALAVGAALAVSGATMQGLFRNPLADPGLIGVTSGAALAACTVLVLGAPSWGTGLASVAVPLAAFAGAAATTLLVMAAARIDGRTHVTTMLLAGIALNAIAGAGTGVLVTISDDAQLRNLSFWMLGSLGGATWALVATVLPFLLLPTWAAMRLARPLDALMLGEGVATSLGVDVERTTRLAVACVALAVGTAVAATGMIGFVGLVVPHLVRLAVGPSHRRVLPLSMGIGGALLVLADLGCRTAIAPAEAPIGVATTLLGGPIFLALMLRERRRLVG